MAFGSVVSKAAKKIRKYANVARDFVTTNESVLRLQKRSCCLQQIRGITTKEKICPLKIIVGKEKLPKTD